MKKDNYKPSKRNWVKLWVDEWLGGTTRFELSEKQRAIWIDLMAMAGKSRFPGVIASGKYEDGYRGYPLSYLAGSLVYNIDDFKEALTVCERYGKIQIEHKIHDEQEDLVIYINNWTRYQSEYQRQKKYSDEDDSPEPDKISQNHQLIYDFWNEQKNLTSHKKITSKMVSRINGALKDFTIDEIKQAIKNYEKLSANKDIYFYYQWSLQDFVSSALHKFTDEAKPFVKYKLKTNNIGEKHKEGIPDDYDSKLKNHLIKNTTVIKEN